MVWNYVELKWNGKTCWNYCELNPSRKELNWNAVASEAHHYWSGEAVGMRLHVNFNLKLLLSQNFCNRPLMRFISFASNIGPAAAVPVGPALAPLKCDLEQSELNRN